MPLFLVLLPVVADAERVLVATASNFARPAAALAAEFERQTAHSVALAAGSTGKLYAQVINGAPYDVLLAADSERPALLEDGGFGVAGSRFTYATGHLVLWSADPMLAGADCREEIQRLGDRHLAIANPLTAPYGVAAESFLVAGGLQQRLADNLVYGENISQTLHFVVSGNATLGLIAASQLVDERLPETACAWPVPPSAHAPISQQAILLRQGESNLAAQAFLDFLRGEAGTTIIRSFGYGVN